MAQRLSLLYSFHAPDFFDRNLFRVYIEGLLANAYLQQDGDGHLVAGRQIAIAERGFVYLLSPEVRRAILQITRQ
jgi:glycerol-3-phosphate O-acyltransferase